MLFIIVIGTPALAKSNEIYYCGGYNSSYTYDAAIFEARFLNSTATQTCTYGKYLDPMCVKMHNRNVADYKAGRCKRMSRDTYTQLKQAQIQNNRQLYYQLINNIQ